MARRASRTPWNEEIQLWRLRFIKRATIADITANWKFLDGDLVKDNDENRSKGDAITEYRVDKSRLTFDDLTYSHWLNLPEDLQDIHPSREEYEEKRLARPQERHPTSPLQEETWGLCHEENHDWLQEKRFFNAAFRARQWYRRTESGQFMAFCVHTCYWCGHEVTLAACFTH